MVVQLVPVSVMNYLCGKKKSAKGVLHHESMLQDIAFPAKNATLHPSFRERMIKDKQLSVAILIHSGAAFPGAIPFTDSAASLWARYAVLRGYSLDHFCGCIA